MSKTSITLCARNVLICFFTLFFILFVNGCKDVSDSSNLATTPKTSFFIAPTKINEETLVDVRPFVLDESHAPLFLDSVDSFDSNCNYQVKGDLEFTTNSSLVGLCQFEYTVTNGAHLSSQRSINVSTNSGEVAYLPQLNQSMHINDLSSTVDVIYQLEQVTGGDEYSQYDLMPTTVVIGDGTAQVSNHNITFTPSYYGNIVVYFTLQNSNGNVAIGNLVFAVSDSNQAPEANNHDYLTPMKYDQKITIDIASLKDTTNNSIVSSPDGDPIYLTQVLSLESVVKLAPKTSQLAFTVEVPKGARPTQDIVYIVSDRKGGYASGIIRVQIAANSPTFILNDTGVEFCVTATGDNGRPSCQLKDSNGVSIPSLQDGHVGRDVLNQEGKLQKIGAGPAGFDYTKLDNQGNELADSAVSWSCTKDNVTGRIWEIKTNDGSINDVSQTFTWYSSDPEINRGNPGVENGGSCDGATFCDTEKYIAHLNSSQRCGHKDWRLPAKQELISIFNYGFDLNNVASLIPQDYFNAPYRFKVWTNESLSGSENHLAHYSRPDQNVFYYTDKSTTNSIMAVSGGQYGDFVRPDRYQFNSNGTVTDITTGLMWSRCPSGKQWNGSQCDGTSLFQPWYEHVKTANSSQLGGHKDWRLPSIKELYSIADLRAESNYDQQIPPQSFYKESVGRYAVSTPNPMGGDFIAVVYETGLLNFAGVPKSYGSVALYCRDTF